MLHYPAASGLIRLRRASLARFDGARFYTATKAVAVLAIFRIVAWLLDFSTLAGSWRLLVVRVHSLAF